MVESGSACERIRSACVPAFLRRRGELGFGVGGRAEFLDRFQVLAGVDVDQRGGAGDLRGQLEVRVDGAFGDLDRLRVGAGEDRLLRQHVLAVLEHDQVGSDRERGNRRTDHDRAAVEADVAQQVGEQHQDEDRARVLVAAGDRFAARETR